MSFVKLFYVSVWIAFKPEALFKPSTATEKQEVSEGFIHSGCSVVVFN